MHLQMVANMRLQSAFHHQSLCGFGRDCCFESANSLCSAPRINAKLLTHTRPSQPSLHPSPATSRTKFPSPPLPWPSPLALSPVADRPSIATPSRYPPTTGARAPPLDHPPPQAGAAAALFPNNDRDDNNIAIICTRRRAHVVSD